MSPSSCWILSVRTAAEPDTHPVTNPDLHLDRSIYTQIDLSTSTSIYRERARVTLTHTHTLITPYPVVTPYLVVITRRPVVTSPPPSPLPPPPPPPPPRRHGVAVPRRMGRGGPLAGRVRERVPGPREAARWPQGTPDLGGGGSCGLGRTVRSRPGGPVASDRLRGRDHGRHVCSLVLLPGRRGCFHRRRHHAGEGAPANASEPGSEKRKSFGRRQSVGRVNQPLVVIPSYQYQSVAVVLLVLVIYIHIQMSTWNQTLQSIAS